MARPNMRPLYIVQIFTLVVRFGYEGLIIPSLVVAENVKLEYGELPGVIAAIVLLRYRGL